MSLPFPVVQSIGGNETTGPDGSRTHRPVLERYYVDPASQFDHEHFRGEWLAAFAPVGSTDWTAVVQERRRAALRPVERVQSSLVEHGLVALAVSCTLIPMVWYFVMRGLNDRHVRLSSYRRAAGAPSESSSFSGST